MKKSPRNLFARNQNWYQMVQLICCGTTALILFFNSAQAGTGVNFASVADYGAVGDGVADDTSKIQNALDHNQTVFFPTPKVAYRVSTLQLHDSQTLVGPGKWAPIQSGTATIVSNARGPIFKTGVYTGPYSDNHLNTDLNVRQITIRDLSADNQNGCSVLQLFNSPDFSIEHVWFKSRTTANTIEAHQSYRGVINDSWIGQCGYGWAISFTDNMNGTTISNNTVTGGGDGNAIDIGMSQAVTITGNRMEVGAGYGIRVGGDNPLGGLCTAITLSGNYFEEIPSPISLGEKFAVIGATVTSNYVANAVSGSTASVHNYFLLAGRVTDSTISGNTYISNGKGTDPVFKFTNFAGADITTCLLNSQIVNNYQWGAAAIYKLDPSVTNGVIVSKIFNLNKISFDGLASTGTSNPIPGTGCSHEYISVPIVAKGAVPATLYATAIPTGGVVDKVEVIDRVGDVTCTVNIGSEVGYAEIAKFNPQTLSYTYGAATAPLAGAAFRGACNGTPAYSGLYSVTAGTGTGSFRLRITYRN